MKKETVLIVVIALVVGLLVGLLVAKQGSKKDRQASVSAPPAATVNFQEKIKLLEDLASREPSNRNAWVQLGHTYFDADQPVKAIEAYDKALQLDANDPDVLTDQGVMFRKLGWYDRAIDNFTKASIFNPNHQQSLFNLGVVYRYDLQDFPRAQEAWRKFLQVSPTGPGAEQVQRELESMRTPPAAAK